MFFKKVFHFAPDNPLRWLIFLRNRFLCFSIPDFRQKSNPNLRFAKNQKKKESLSFDEKTTETRYKSARSFSATNRTEKIAVRSSSKRPRPGRAPLSISEGRKVVYFLSGQQKWFDFFDFIVIGIPIDFLKIHAEIGLTF